VYIKRLKIKNYKGFNESEWMEFGPSFNVIVGQNNSGKTALLEAIRLHGAENKPHKSAKKQKGHPSDPHSIFEFDLTTTSEEFVDLIQRTRSVVITPSLGPNQDGLSQIKSALSSKTIDFQIQFSNGVRDFQPRAHSSFISHLENCGYGVQISPSSDPHQIEIGGYAHSRSPDALPGIFFRGYSDRFYVFKAERLALGTYGLSDETILLPNGANLAAVLANMFSNSDKKKKQFNDHITSIFPSIKLIQAPNVGGQYRIKIWTTDPQDDRDDLANFLEDSGTGIGQVLAILYVAMTMPPSVIAIDEPNSFLHPGAAKKLLRILNQYEHQYIISTHSTDIISTVEPDSLHLVRWEGGESKVTALNASEVRDMRIVLNEVGVGLSDVFASDQVIWVEGQTEQECFPKIYAYSGKKLPLGLSFIAVHNTGDFEAKDWTARKIWELYDTLGQANGILPVAIAFSLDKEMRTQAEMDDMARQTGGKMHFLPRRAYENFLIHPEAVAQNINKYVSNSTPVTAQDVETWISNHGGAFHKDQLTPYGAKSVCWHKECDAAKLLGKLYADLSGATLQYNKTRHSVEITEWLLANETEHLSKLIDYVGKFVPSETTH
jgi:hypothetical protein